MPFPTTAWTVNSQARHGHTDESRGALASLCEAYWQPIYSYARRLGHSADEASDLTQGYFALLIEKDYLGDVRLREGRFRAFLLTSFRHFLSKERDRVRALKRGGGLSRVSLDTAEARYLAEPRDVLTPEAAFEREWALTMLERALLRLREEVVTAEKEGAFERLRGYLTGQEPTTPYSEAAKELNTTERAVTMMVHRLRRRYGALVRSEIAETVADPAQAEAELRHLLSVVRPWEPRERA